MTTEAVLQCILSGIAMGAVYALIAIGFNIIYNATGVINFAQGEFAMMGAMSLVMFRNNWGWPMPLALLAAIALVTVIGVLFERLAIRPARRSGVLTLILITIGGSYLLKGVAMILWGKDSLVTDAFLPIDSIEVFGAIVLPQDLIVWAALIYCVIGLELFFRLTLAGKAMRACAVNSKAARLMGIDVSRMVMVSFALSAAIGALGGAVVVPISQVDYHRGAIWGLMGFSAAVVGGLGNMFGAVFAGLLLGILQAFCAYHISTFKDAIALSILLVVLFVRPSGIFGRAGQSALKEF